MQAPALSVVIAVYNRPVTIQQALQSALDQDYAGRYEVIVIDDGSTDSTPEVLAAYGQRVHIIRQQHLGRSAARNAGVRYSSANLVAFLDSDAYLPPVR